MGEVVEVSKASLKPKRNNVRVAGISAAVLPRDSSVARLRLARPDATRTVRRPQIALKSKIFGRENHAHSINMCTLCFRLTFNVHARLYVVHMIVCPAILAERELVMISALTPT